MCSYATSWMHIRSDALFMQLFSCTRSALSCHIADRLDGCACSRVGLQGMNQKPPQNDTVTLTHLQRLESESIHIMREVVSESKKPVMLYSAGKDSAVMLHLARKAFFPGGPPFPPLHVDTGWKFRAINQIPDQGAHPGGLQFIVAPNPHAAPRGVYRIRLRPLDTTLL